MELDRAMRIAASGMNAQTARLRVVAENLANRDTTPEIAGANPYPRKTGTLSKRLYRAQGANNGKVCRVFTQKGGIPTPGDPPARGGAPFCLGASWKRECPRHSRSTQGVRGRGDR